MIKKVLISSLFIILIFSFIYLKNNPNNYTVKYNINKYKIIEEYNKNNSLYQFKIEYNSIEFPYLIKNDFINKKELIKNVKIHQKGKELCLLPVSDDLTFYLMCYDDDFYINHNMKNKNIKFAFKKHQKNDEQYENVNIKSKTDLHFLIYNYNGFYYIDNKEKKNIKLFDMDNYNINLIYQLNNYVIIADYNEQFYFNKFYVINLKNGKLETISIDNNVSFNSEFIGNNKNNVYLYDQKEKTYYEINISRMKINQIDDITKDIKNKTYNFYNYQIIDNKLYMEINNELVRITNIPVDEIVKIDTDIVYYISKDNLYRFDFNYGETLLLSNFEWNFNNTNKIFIYE